MSIPENHPAIVEARRRGLLPPDEPIGEPKTGVLAPSHEPGSAVWVVGVEVPSLANSSKWQLRSRVSQAHRRAVSRAFGRSLADVVPFAAHFHAGGVVRVVLTRLGGRALDRTANLPASLKYVEDGVALIIGADDGAPNWRCEVAQEPGGATGVRIELHTEG